MVDYINRLSESITDIPKSEWPGTIYSHIVIDTVGRFVKVGMFGKSESEYNRFDKEVVPVL